MALIFWPEGLPDDLLMEGLSIEPQNNVIRTAMDAGPQKARRRYSARAIRFSGVQRYDLAEMMVFEMFFHTVLADGVLRFNFTDPVTQESGEFRFAENYRVVTVEGFFEVSIVLEKL